MPWWYYNFFSHSLRFLSHFSLYYFHLFSLTSISVIIYICWPHESSIFMRSYAWSRTYVVRIRVRNGIMHTGQTTSYIKDAVTPISQDPTANSSPPTLRRHHRLRGIENTDQVWRDSILCGWTIHTELSARVSEKDWLHWDFRLPWLCCVLIFHCFIDYCNARPVRLVVDLALNTIEHWTL